MPKEKRFQILLLLFVALVSFSLGNAQAYSTEVVNNLKRTRDALLDQRSHLDQNAANIKRKISEYERQLDVVNSYLRDTDNALRDVDDAIRKAG